MDISKFLSKVIGLYLIVITSAMLVSMHEFLRILHELLMNAPLLLVTGIFTLILGLIMVVSHNIWKCNWQVAITIIAWIILLKGACTVLFPQFVDKSALTLLQNINIAYITAVLDLILGILLTYFGFKR